MRSPEVRVYSKTGGARKSSGEPRKLPKGLRSRSRRQNEETKCPGRQGGERLKGVLLCRQQDHGPTLRFMSYETNILKCREEIAEQELKSVCVVVRDTLQNAVPCMLARSSIFGPLAFH